jgi:hypothetical protein
MKTWWKGLLARSSFKWATPGHRSAIQVLKAQHPDANIRRSLAGVLVALVSILGLLFDVGAAANPRTGNRIRLFIVPRRRTDTVRCDTRGKDGTGRLPDYWSFCGPPWKISNTASRPMPRLFPTGAATPAQRPCPNRVVRHVVEPTVSQAMCAVPPKRKLPEYSRLRAAWTPNRISDPSDEMNRATGSAGGTAMREASSLPAK